MPNRNFFSFCTSLQPLELKALGELSQVQHLENAAMIYRAGDAADALYIISRGVVEIVPEDASSGVPGIFLSRGDVFGDVEALTGLPRKNSARAVEPISLQAIQSKDFGQLVRRLPSFFRFLAEQLAARLLQAHDTAAAASPDQRLELSGNLANFDLVTVYQTIVNSSQTGELSVSNESGELISAFYFEAGQPRFGQFQHLTGEEAFWQLFLAENLRGTFSFASGEKKISHMVQGGSLERNPTDLLINALQYRDEFLVLRQRMPNPRAIVARQKLEFTSADVAPELFPVAEEVWRRLFGRRMSLADLCQHLFVCEMKIYQAVDALVRSGHASLSAVAPLAEMVA